MHPDRVISDLQSALAVALSVIDPFDNQDTSTGADYVRDMFDKYKDYVWCYTCDELMSYQDRCKHIEML